jgi:hypothetical protein
MVRGHVTIDTLLQGRHQDTLNHKTKNSVPHSAMIRGVSTSDWDTQESRLVLTVIGEGYCPHPSQGREVWVALQSLRPFTVITRWLNADNSALLRDQGSTSRAPQHQGAMVAWGWNHVVLSKVLEPPRGWHYPRCWSHPDEHCRYGLLDDRPETLDTGICMLCSAVDAMHARKEGRGDQTSCLIGSPVWLPVR